MLKKYMPLILIGLGIGAYYMWRKTTAMGYQDRIPGGLADNKTPDEFNKTELRKGIKVEMEHTNDPDIAREIAMDHLTEDSQYYVKLAQMEGH